ncbi:MAG: DUF444 family protein [Rhodopila sp.]|jgi:predicted Ser/Thr protein kinase
MTTVDDIFTAYARTFEAYREAEMSLSEYLDACKKDPLVYSTATERLLAAIGEPEMVDTSKNPRLGRIFMNRTIRDHLLPGNKEYIAGDTDQRPAGGGGGSEGSPDGEGEDDFRFALSRDEFVDLFLEDLELPDLAKRRVVNTEALVCRRAYPAFSEFYGMEETIERIVGFQGIIMAHSNESEWQNAQVAQETTLAIRRVFASLSTSHPAFHRTGPPPTN